jgi:hypothetical protein
MDQKTQTPRFKKHKFVYNFFSTEEEKELIINDFKKIISEATSVEKISRNWANLNKDREGYNKKGHQVII